MAAITVFSPRTVPAVLRHRAVHKLGLLALAAAVLVPLANARWAGGAWPDALTVDLTKPLTDASTWIVDNRDTHPLFLYFFGHVSNAIVLCVRAVYLVLLAAGWAGVTALSALVAWRVAGLRLALGTVAAFLTCGWLGMWVPTMQTLALMVVAVIASVAVGALLGLAGGLSDRLNRALRPVLDTMQVLPAYAYLLPVVLVFGMGVPAAVLATVVYAAPPMARLTALGLRGADKEVLEAVRSLGATARQGLLTARIPLARKELLLGLNQTIMMALSMAVIASVIGAAASATASTRRSPPSTSARPSPPASRSCCWPSSWTASPERPATAPRPPSRAAPDGSTPSSPPSPSPSPDVSWAASTGPTPGPCGSPNPSTAPSTG